MRNDLDTTKDELDQSRALPPAWSIKARNFFRAVTFICFTIIPAAGFLGGSARSEALVLIAGLSAIGSIVSFLIWVGIVLTCFRCQFSLLTLLLLVFGIGACGALLCAEPGPLKILGSVGVAILFILTVRGISKFDSTF